MVQLERNISRLIQVKEKRKKELLLLEVTQLVRLQATRQLQLSQVPHIMEQKLILLLTHQLLILQLVIINPILRQKVTSIMRDLSIVLRQEWLILGILKLQLILSSNPIHIQLHPKQTLVATLLILLLVILIILQQQEVVLE